MRTTKKSILQTYHLAARAQVTDSRVSLRDSHRHSHTLCLCTVVWARVWAARFRARPPPHTARLAQEAAAAMAPCALSRYHQRPLDSLMLNTSNTITQALAAPYRV